MAITLLDMLGKKIRVIDANKQLKGVELPKPVVSQSVGLNMEQARFTHSLIKHLDMIYGKMLAGVVSEMAQPVKYIAGKPHVETRSWYNPGHSAVTESA